MAKRARGRSLIRFVTFNTRFHRSLALLPEQVSCGNRAVTRFASILGIPVAAVSEEDKRGQQIDPRPRNRLVRLRVLEQRPKGWLRTVAALMAIHAVCSLRNSGLFTIRQRVADFALQSQLSVALVAEFDRLFDRLGGHGLAGFSFLCDACECRCHKQSCEENCAVDQRRDGPPHPQALSRVGERGADILGTVWFVQHSS